MHAVNRAVDLSAEERSKRSILIGDQDTDIAAARRAGIEGVLFAGGGLRALAEEALDKIIGKIPRHPLTRKSL